MDTTKITPVPMKCRPIKRQQHSRCGQIPWTDKAQQTPCILTAIPDRAATSNPFLRVTRNVVNVGDTRTCATNCYPTM